MGMWERLIGSIRRECLDHVVVFGERHLRHVLLSYMEYYNGARTHLALNKDAPVSRAIQAVGRILPMQILGGLLAYEHVRSSHRSPSRRAMRKFENGGKLPCCADLCYVCYVLLRLLRLLPHYSCADQRSRAGVII